MKSDPNSWKYQQSSSNFLSKPNLTQLIAKIFDFAKNLLQWRMEPPELKVWQTWDKYGNIYWNGYDPITQRSIYQVSESQIRVWIEQRHHQ